MSKPKYFFCTALVFLSGFLPQIAYNQSVSKEVLIRRTEFGVPHIQAKNVKAAGYAMGYLQMEDYGNTVIEGLVRARGEWAKYHELENKALENQFDRDAVAKLLHLRAEETYKLLRKDTRDLTQGYAEGINRYIELHPDEFPKWIQPDFTAEDVHAVGITKHSDASVKSFLRNLDEQSAFAPQHHQPTSWATVAALAKEQHPDAGSNVWALGPERTTSGKAILLRNPHLNWGAGYYEAHMQIDGYFNFYGDFRIGQPLGVIGGFNEHLGWCTTNNYPVTDEIYGLKKDPKNPDKFLLDGKSISLEKKTVEVEYKAGERVEKVKKEFLFTSFGPVIHQTKDRIYVIKSVDEGEYRANEQYLQMMRAKNLDEWKQAMRIRGLTSSNFTYADGEGNIFYVWNGSVPMLKKPSDSNGTLVSKRSEIWTDLYPWDKLPQLLNPKGGYLHNENDPFHFTNLNEIFHEADFPSYFSRPKLGLRSQLSLKLIGGNDKLSPEDVVKRKHDMTMLLATRVKEDLLKFTTKAGLNKAEKQAWEELKNWDNTVAAESRGSVLFEMWWSRYVDLISGGKRMTGAPESAGFPAPAEKLFAVPWSTESPVTTPYGLADEENAVKAFQWAVAECLRKYGTLYVKWGDVHRAVIGNQDYPVGGANGALGVFRVLWFRPVENSTKMRVTGGDGWVLAVEFGETPRAYSVLAYGESNKESSPHYGDQLQMFVDNRMKRVYYTKEDIEKNTLRSYHPGE